MRGTKRKMPYAHGCWRRWIREFESGETDYVYQSDSPDARLKNCWTGTGLHRAQHRMLMTLSDCPVTSQIELANILEVSAATVAVSLKKLEKGGYIQKTQQEQDSRVRFVELTEKGRGVVEESKEIFHQMDAKLLEGFDKEQLEVLQSLLGQMYRNAKNIE